MRLESKANKKGILTGPKLWKPFSLAMASAYALAPAAFKLALRRTRT